MLDNVMQQIWKMTPKWRSKSIKKMIQKNITNNDAKMKCPKAPDPKVLMGLACWKR